MANCMNFLSLFRKTKSVRIMHVQAQLLKELGLSSDSAKNWRNRIKTILSEAATVIDVYFLYAFLAGEDGKYDLELFWLKGPSSKIKDAVERVMKQKLAEDSEFSKIREFNIIHSTADLRSPLQDINVDKVEIQTKTFYIETPRESGIAGIGLRGRARRRIAESLVIDSTLTAFTNVICSFKALSAYTKNVERFATRDPLTNLYNQISFWDLLEYETNRSRRHQYKFSLLVIDLDNFKEINDAHGHENGDAFLKDFSSILKNAVRTSDIAARYAGDQFTAILPVCDEGQAAIVARRILEDLREFTFTTATGETIKGTVSIGVAVFPDHAKEAKDLYLLADSMLSHAKSSGKDRLILPSEQDDVEVLKSMGEKSILVLEALARHRIIPYFQPIMNVKDMRIEAFEVLTRIIMHDRVIPAAEFIETAEGMGAIGKIDYQLFEHALAKARESGYAGDLFINLSPRALALDEFIPTVLKLWRDSGLDPDKLVFEIAERDMVKNMQSLGKFIHKLKNEGFRFAIDDFGSGYSSLQYLRMFKVDFLKVDGAFILNMTGDETVEEQIVICIAALAKHLGIKTIAKHVETKALLTKVESAGIDYAQGYYIQRPSPDLF